MFRLCAANRYLAKSQPIYKSPTASRFFRLKTCLKRLYTLLMLRDLPGIGPQTWKKRLYLAGIADMKTLMTLNAHICARVGACGAKNVVSATRF